MNIIRIIGTVAAMTAGPLILLWINIHADDKAIENIEKQHVILRPSIFFPIFGVVMLLVDVFLTVGVIKESPEKWGFPLVCNAFCLGCGIPLLLRANVRIEIDKSADFFDYRSMFRKRHRVYYCDIISFRWNIEMIGSEVYLRTKRRTYHIELTGMEQYSLVNAIKLHKIPEEDSTRKKPRKRKK